jgi:hypothetical protein
VVYDNPPFYRWTMDDTLRAELLRRVEVDQAARKAWDAEATARADGVDQRRAAVGLGPLAEYLRRFEDVELPEESLSCPGCGERVPYESTEDGEPVVVTCGACGMKTTVRTIG